MRRLGCRCGRRFSWSRPRVSLSINLIYLRPKQPTNRQASSHVICGNLEVPYRRTRTRVSKFGGRFMVVLALPAEPSLAASRSLPSLATRTPSRSPSTSALSTPAGSLLSEQLLVHLHRAAKKPQAAVAKNPQALPLHASGALERRTLSNTQLPTIVGGLMRAQRAKFLDQDITRDDSKARSSLLHPHPHPHTDPSPHLQPPPPPPLLRKLALNLTLAHTLTLTRSGCSSATSAAAPSLGWCSTPSHSHLCTRRSTRRRVDARKKMPSSDTCSKAARRVLPASALPADSRPRPR